MAGLQAVTWLVRGRGLLLLQNSRIIDKKKHGKNAWAVSEEVCLRIDDSLSLEGFISAFLVDKSENLFFINQDYMLQYRQVSDANKSSIPGRGYFAKLELFENNHCEKGELCIEYRKNACKEKSGELCDFCKRERGYQL